MAGKIDTGVAVSCGNVQQQLRSTGTLLALGVLNSRSSVLARLVPSASHVWLLAVHFVLAVSLVAVWWRWRQRRRTSDDLVVDKRTTPLEERSTARRWRRGQWLLGVWMAASTMARSGQLAREPSMAPEQLEVSPALRLGLVIEC